MKPVLDLVREVHRRSLWQVLGIYLVASWGVIQVVDTLASVLADLGRTEEAVRALEVLEEGYRSGSHHLPHLLAIGRAAVGDAADALDWREQAARDRDGALPWITVDPAYDSLRGEPRFRALLERMGLDGVAALRSRARPSAPAP